MFFSLCLGRLLPKTFGLLYVGNYDQPFAEIKVRKPNVLLRWIHPLLLVIRCWCFSTHCKRFFSNSEVQKIKATFCWQSSIEMRMESFAGSFVLNFFIVLPFLLLIFDISLQRGYHDSPWSLEGLTMSESVQTLISVLIWRNKRIKICTASPKTAIISIFSAKKSICFSIWITFCTVN